jgi:hypothetical protein
MLGALHGGGDQPLRGRWRLRLCMGGGEQAQSERDASAWAGDAACDKSSHRREQANNVLLMMSVF